jgi:hypothetical protein
MTKPSEDRVWSPEQEAALRGFLPMRPNQTFPYTPRVYRQKGEDGSYLFPKEMWPVFTLRAKDGLGIASLEDEMEGVMEGGEMTAIRVRTGSQRLQVLRAGLVNCKGWRDLEGKEVAFSRDAGKRGSPVSDGFLRELPQELQIELFNAITERSELSEEEKIGLKF